MLPSMDRRFRGTEMDFALLVLASTISIYWTTVVLLVVYRRLRHGHSAGVIPRQRFERRLYRILLPVFLAWITLPWLAMSVHVPGLALPNWAADVPWVFGVRAVAAGIAVGCYLLSLVCWLRMGRSWTMAIVPKQETQLVTAGPYGWVRHPIYALSILLMLMSAVALPTLPMVVAAGLHFYVMRRKARHEEGHLRAQFGAEYERYCARVGRFCPRLLRKAA
jgi:protein-S-isoprenylcysteine O-methyltransferase Ste14